MPAGLAPAAVAVAPAGATSPSSLAPTCNGEAGDESASAALAAACDREVEVLDARSEWASTFALPDGSMRLDTSIAAVRTDVSGEWEPVDSSVVEGDGGLVVASAVTPMTFSDGSDGAPLARIERDGHEVVFDAPFDLPAPSVDGSQVTYAQVLPGVDLVVTVNEDATGFSEVLRVESPEAAAHPALAELTFDVETSDGIELQPTDGAFVAADASGEAVFTSPVPTMWDSRVAMPGWSGVGAAPMSDVDPTVAPAPGAVVAPMATAVAADTVTVTPDADLLADPATAWPVFLDPGMSGSLNQRTAVRTVVGTAYNFAGDEGVGLCDRGATTTCSHTFRSRVLWQFASLQGLGNLEPSDVQSAVFAVTGTHSYSCTPMPVTLHAVADFDAGTVYPGGAYWKALQTQTITHRAGCGAGKEPRRIEFDATQQARDVAAANTGVASFGMAADEGSMASWKRYGWDASFSVTYNRPPAAPANARTTAPDSACVVGNGRPHVRSTQPTLRAVLGDPDGGNVQAHIDIVDLGNGAHVWDPALFAAQGSGAEHALQVPANLLVDGRSYRWNIQAFDGQVGGPWVSCEFTVDLTAPVMPVVTPVTGTGLAVYAEGPTLAGGVGHEGRFTFGNGGSTDVEYYRYTFLGQQQRTVPVGSVVQFVPTEVGSQTLTVESIDRAGWVSPARVYRFTVTFPALSDAWHLDETSGTTAANVNGSNRVLTLSSGTSNNVDGLGATNFGRPADRALQFDAVSDVARTTQPVVRTDGSYSVMATVRLDDVAGTYVAVSQSGTQTSGFALGHRADPACPEGTGGHCWAFWTTGTDSASATPVVVRSDVPARAGQWVQLTGIRNAGTGQLDLAVCAYGAPGELMTPQPVLAGVLTAPTGWAAGGAFQVGRGGTTAAPQHGWKGAVNQVRTYTGPLTILKLRQSCGNVGTVLAPTLDAPPASEPAPPPPAPLPSVQPGQPGFEAAYVASLYRDVLGREAGYSELVVWTSEFKKGASLQAVAQGIATSPEWHQRFVEQQYQLFLGRSADPTGMSTWLTAFSQGKDTFAVEHGIVASAEYFARAGSNDTGLVRALYRDLLGREAGASEIAYWLGHIQTYGRGALIRELVYTDEHVNRVIDQRYREVLGRGVDAAGLSTSAGALRSGGTVQQLIVRLAASGEYQNGRVRAL
ncbi:DUF4214 domain-containing protein [Cellulomonas sp. Sa3CUA2]|uniref:DUF4214 domain-containing protein n=1 Tax=Cellulomonas avistercoris TaxID=2762242 RepID=A0ABR8QBQ2_9CELL|nr:DUF4214 domain-containing protein [Cellulomonas avistercoris]MBD7917821.1 DUF4214 domain-containing protein [Cellulomonas avistercoris]